MSCQAVLAKGATSESDSLLDTSADQQGLYGPACSLLTEDLDTVCTSYIISTQRQQNHSTIRRNMLQTLVASRTLVHFAQAPLDVMPELSASPGKMRIDVCLRMVMLKVPQLN